MINLFTSKEWKKEESHKWLTIASTTCPCLLLKDRVDQAIPIKPMLRSSCIQTLLSISSSFKSFTIPSEDETPSPCRPSTPSQSSVPLIKSVGLYQLRLSSQKVSIMESWRLGRASINFGLTLMTICMWWWRMVIQAINMNGILSLNPLLWWKFSDAWLECWTNFWWF